MIEDNKYYTPTIEEFYVGFEYEFSYLDWPNKEQQSKEDYKSTDPILVTWHKDTFNPYSGKADMIKRNPRYIDLWLSSGQIRVKYLDYSDIKDLGFAEVAGSSASKEQRATMKFSKGGYNLDYYSWYAMGSTDPNAVFDYDKATLYRKVIIKHDNADSHLVGGNTLFNGTIKNKSELVKLLKQLNIE